MEIPPETARNIRSQMETSEERFSVLRRYLLASYGSKSHVAVKIALLAAAHEALRSEIEEVEQVPAVPPYARRKVSEQIEEASRGDHIAFEFTGKSASNRA